MSISPILIKPLNWNRHISIGLQSTALAKEGYDVTGTDVGAAELEVKVWFGY